MGICLSKLSSAPSAPSAGLKKTLPVVPDDEIPTVITEQIGRTGGKQIDRTERSSLDGSGSDLDPTEGKNAQQEPVPAQSICPCWKAKQEVPVESKIDCWKDEAKRNLDKLQLFAGGGGGAAAQPSRFAGGTDDVWMMIVSITRALGVAEVGENAAAEQ